MTQIILDKAILQEVPEGASEFKIIAENMLHYKADFGPIENVGRLVQLPSGQYEILGLGGELGEQQAEQAVGVYWRENGKYENYETANARKTFDTALDSFASLLRSHNLQPETTLVILKK